jgi:predicted acyl esterase
MAAVAGHGDGLPRTRGRTPDPEPPYTADQPEEFTYDPFDPVPTTGGALLLSDEFPAVPLDQTAMVARKDVLVFNVNSTATAPDFALDGITLTVH